MFMSENITRTWHLWLQMRTCCTSTGIKRQNSLDSNVHSRHIEGFKHDLGHLLPVGLRVEWCLSKKYWVLFRGNTKLIVESVMPNLLHVIPIANNAMLYRILQGEDTSFRLGFITNISIFLTHPNHDTGMTRSPNNTWEHCPRSIITSKSSLQISEGSRNE